MSSRNTTSGKAAQRERGREREREGEKGRYDLVTGFIPTESLFSEILR